jgi:2-dehydro-3-deoxyphosphogluconate aldolase/(4S)-4-hydroxy-2-oxoglutarate aldolase
MTALDLITSDRVLAVVRADSIPDPTALATALADGGIRTVEFTFTTPGLAGLVRAVAAMPDVAVGAGTVLTADQAREAIDAGASFIVTPGVRPDVASVVTAAGVTLLMGALTPSEVMVALDLGADAVKIFPARTVGARYFSDLRGPFPGARLLPSGGVDESNAAEFLRAGAIAVSAGTSVVSPKLVVDGGFEEITARAKAFVAAFSAA